MEVATSFQKVANPVTQISPLSGAGLSIDHQPKPALCGFFFLGKSQQKSTKHQRLAGAGIRAGIHK